MNLCIGKINVFAKLTNWLIDFFSDSRTLKNVQLKIWRWCERKPWMLLIKLMDWLNRWISDIDWLIDTLYSRYILLDLFFLVISITCFVEALNRGSLILFILYKDTCFQFSSQISYLKHNSSTYKLLWIRWDDEK